MNYGSEWDTEETKISLMLANLPWLFLLLLSERLYLIFIAESSEYFLIGAIWERKALITPGLCKQNNCLAFENWQEHRF